MEQVIIIILLLILVAMLVLFVTLLRGRGRGSAISAELKGQNDDLRREFVEAIARSNSQVSEQIANVARQMQISTGQFNARLDNATRMAGEVRQGLGALGKATQRIFEVGKDIAGLEDILKTPKLRGGFGEFFLHEILSQILPPSSFALQHSFTSGARVDAVIKLKGGLVPIDSKFPLENFKRIRAATNDMEKRTARKKFATNIRKHIDDIAASYIVPGEGTLNFALMYIPAENVYYETIIKDDGPGLENRLSAYAFSKRVVPVSPNTLYAYLQTVLMGLRGMEISKKAELVLARLNTLERDLESFRGDFDILGTHLNNAGLKYDSTRNKLDRFFRGFSDWAESTQDVPLEEIDDIEEIEVLGDEETN